MSSQPYLRAADDGTYELLIPFDEDSVHVLPYCFHTAEDAVKWLASRKGREQIQHIRPKGGLTELISCDMSLKRSRPRVSLWGE